MSRSTVNARKAVVLLVDDEAPARMALREALEQADFVVEEADAGRIAIERLEQRRADLVLLDDDMPAMDGFETCRALRGLAGGAHAPIVLMSGHESADSMERAMEAGATSFVANPLGDPLLIHRLRYLLQAKITADALRDSEARLAKAQALAKLGHWEWDVASGGAVCSESLCTLLGLPAAGTRLSFRGFVSLVDPRDRPRVRKLVYRALKAGRGYTIDHRIVRADGAERVVYQEVEAVTDAHGRLERLIGIVQDITERRRSEEKIRYLAYFDPVTGLANRSLLKQFFNHTLANARRYSRNFALFFIDLDNFKEINDSLGHDAGDAILREMALRMRRCLRTSDRLARPDGEDGPIPGGSLGGDLVTRLGGDEFVVLLTELCQPENAAAVARRLADAIAQPITVGDRTVAPTASVGIACYPIDGPDFPALLKKADLAMYRAKQSGRNCVRYATEALNLHAARKCDLESELAHALKTGAFVLHYQPKIGIADRRIAGVEALVRWEHPVRGLVAPAEFIPFAEEFGQIRALGEWILDTAMAQAAAWRAAGHPELAVSVNISASQFADPAFAERIGARLGRFDLPAEALVLEITERVVLENREHNMQAIQALHALGVRIAMDDFGAGASSLACLVGLPLGALKIDRSLVAQTSSDLGSNAMVQAIVDLAGSLKLTSIAEGVETEEQLAFLRNIGCDVAQGYLFCRPLPAGALGAWMADHAPSMAGDDAGPEPGLMAVGA